MANVQHIVTGAGAPSSAPPAVGAHYIDTTNKKTYVSTGTAAASDWGQPLATGTLIVTGTAAPSSAPPAVGAHYVNTTAKKTYIAVGTASSADWLPLVTGAASVVVTGSGAPSSAPPSIGAMYVDSATNNVFVATGTASSADWGNPVFRGDPGEGGGDVNGIVYTTDYFLDPDPDGVTFSIPSDRRIVEMEMPNADDTGSNQATLKLAQIPVSEDDHELLVIVRRANEGNAAELVLPAMVETGGGSNEVYYTVIPQTLGGTAGTLFDTTWTIPIPIGFSAFRVYRRYGRAYFIASLAQ